MSLFQVDPDSGSVIYVTNEEAEKNDGIFSDSDDSLGSVQDSETILEENVVETEEESTDSSVLDSGSDRPVLVFDEELMAALLADAPASGAIGSSTLDYFDRIVSGLPSDAVYVAYRNNSDDSYDAVLYYGQDYSLDGNRIDFGSDCIEILVDRTSTSGYNNVTNYYSSDASYTSVEFSQDGAVVYYTNVVPGYPVLGGLSQPLSLTPLLISSIAGALFLVVLTKLFFRR